MSFKPSIYQQSIFDFIADKSEGHALVNAVAGSGKSTTIHQAIQLIPENKSVLLLAFNKSIVEDLKKKIGGKSNVTVSTLHSLGMKAIMKQHDVTVDATKYRRFIFQYFDGKNIPEGVYPEEELDFKMNILNLVNLGRVNLAESSEDLDLIAQKFNMTLIRNETHFAMRFIKWGIQKEDVIDFTDMIYWPLVKKLWVNKFHWVFIDECQDLNAAQRELFLKCLRTDGRFIAVGDPKQAIYGFAGSDIESFNLLKGLNGVKEFPLSVCYRCDSLIIDVARQLVPQIQSRENAPPGIVESASYKTIVSGDMVLCRFTAPLTKLCMTLILEGKKARIQGKDLGLNLIKMIKKTKAQTIDELYTGLSLMDTVTLFKISTQYKIDIQMAKTTTMYEAFRDMFDAIIVLSEGLTLVQLLINRIEDIFNDDSVPGILLSTIHKSKGLESDRVFILHPDNMRSQYAKHLDWAYAQEYNLEYVAYTRAKHYLGFINDIHLKKV